MQGSHLSRWLHSVAAVRGMHAARAYKQPGEAIRPLPLPLLQAQQRARGALKLPVDALHVREQLVKECKRELRCSRIDGSIAELVASDQATNQSDSFQSRLTVYVVSMPQESAGRRRVHRHVKVHRHKKVHRHVKCTWRQCHI